MICTSIKSKLTSYFLFESSDVEDGVEVLLSLDLEEL